MTPPKHQLNPSRTMLCSTSGDRRVGRISVSVAVRPVLRCNGTGRNSGSNSKRFGGCRRCKGSGRRPRLDTRTIHRGAVSLADKARTRKGGK
jgi:hypothetical protein